MKPVPKEIEAEKDQKTEINDSIRYGKNVLRFLIPGIPVLPHL